MKKVITTENKGEVVLHVKHRPKVSGYTVYNNKVYRVVASAGMITDFSYTLESTINNERFTVKQPEAGELRELIQPTGYITC